MRQGAVVSTLAARVLLACAFSARASSFTYNVDFTVGSTNVTGQIVTSCDNNCMLGTVNQSDTSGQGNLVSWYFTDGTDTFSSSGSLTLGSTTYPNNFFAGSGLFLEATPTGIVDEPVTGGQNSWGDIFRTANESQYIEFYNTAAGSDTAYIKFADGTSTSAPVSVPYTFATTAPVAATPEPSSVFLLGTGLVSSAGLLLCRRVRLS